MPLLTNHLEKTLSKEWQKISMALPFSPSLHGGLIPNLRVVILLKILWLYFLNWQRSWIFSREINFTTFLVEIDFPEKNHCALRMLLHLLADANSKLCSGLKNWKKVKIVVHIGFLNKNIRLFWGIVWIVRFLIEKFWAFL